MLLRTWLRWSSPHKRVARGQSRKRPFRRKQRLGAASSLTLEKLEERTVLSAYVASGAEGEAADSADINGDGVLTSGDLLPVIQVLRGQSSDNSLSRRADANRDGAVTTADLLVVVEAVRNGRSALTRGSEAAEAILANDALVSDLAGQKSPHIYTTKFDDPPFEAGQPLVGQDGWVGVPILSPNAALVSTEKPRQGKQSVQVWGGDLEHQDFIHTLTDGYYDAIGSYRKPLGPDGFDTSGDVRVRLSAHVRIDGPLTSDVNFFSAALSARAEDGDGNPNTTIGIGQIDLSSDGHAYAHDGNQNVPDFQASAPITLGEWHTLAIVLDFAEQTYTLSVDDQPLGTFSFPAGVNSNILTRGALIAFTAPDTDTMTKEDYTATFDNFTIQVVGKTGGD